MLKRVIVIAGLLSLVAVTGCGDGGVGTEGDVVGGSCGADDQCADGSRCLVESDFPGGTCTVNCASQDDCPGGTVCVQENGGTCLLACDSADECREGYGCEEKSRLGAPDGALVCIN